MNEHKFKKFELTQSYSDREREFCVYCGTIRELQKSTSATELDKWVYSEPKPDYSATSTYVIPCGKSVSG